MPVLCCSEVHKIWYSEEVVLIILNIFQAPSVFPYKGFQLFSFSKKFSKPLGIVEDTEKDYRKELMT
jgi:hypothetical protein